MEAGDHFKNGASLKILMNRMLWSIFIIFLITATGCTKKESEEMTLSDSALSFPYTGDEKTFIVFSNVKRWTVSSDASDWLTLSRTTGANNALVKVIASANTGTSARSATITVQESESKSQDIRVSQATAPILLVSLNQLNFTSAGGEKTFTVTSNSPWSGAYLFPSTAPSIWWFTKSPHNGDGKDNIINVTCSPNTIGYPREAGIQITIKDLSQIIRVIQEP